jgi:hypothetical protein
MALYLNTHLGRPTPAHALTPGAEAARAAVRSLPPSRLVAEVTKRGITMQPARAPLTRREVEEAYVHPEPEVRAEEVDVSPHGDRTYWVFARKATAAGADVKVTVARGTTPPKWHVNAPDSKPNPGPPVDASQYHGDLVDSVVVWARKLNIITSGMHRTSLHVRAEWHNGRIHEVTVNGARSSLKAALEALGA